MLKLFNKLAQYMRWSRITTDSTLFRVHNQLTAVMLLAASVVLTANQYVGSPISCLVQGLPEHVVNTFCWITSTFTMPDAFLREVGKEVAHPGVANDLGNFSARKYYAYYQWVCFLLFFQAMLCLVPQWLWSFWESGLMETLVMGMDKGMDSEANITLKKNTLMDYLRRHAKCHKLYVYRYFACEVLCLVNICSQLFLMNRFLGGDFFSYGLRVLQYSSLDQDQRADPMIYMFPRMTKCIFHKYGPSGSLQTHDSLCLLPLNIFNEKAYIFFWFWYFLLSALLVGLLMYRALIIFVPIVRARLLHISAKLLPIETCKSVNKKVDIGDWWILYNLAYNMDSVIYRDFLVEFAKIGDDSAMNV